VITVGPPEAWRSYFSAGRSFMPGLAVIEASQSVGDATHTLTAGFAAEALLKALLSFRGISEEQLSSQALGHDLHALWARCWSLQAVPQQEPPAWLTLLQAFHFKGNPEKKKFFIRYQSGGGA
jgi:hypothetical protein